MSFSTFKGFLKEGRVSLYEAIRLGDFNKASVIIGKYITRTVCKTFCLPEPEVVKSRGKEYIGIRYLLDDDRSIRLNWLSSISAASNLVSFDYWDGSGAKQLFPSHHIEFDVDQQRTLVKSLPFIKDFLNGKIKDKSGYYVDDDTLSESHKIIDTTFLSEAVVTEDDIVYSIKGIIDGLSQGEDFYKQCKSPDRLKLYGKNMRKVQGAIRELYPIFSKSKYPIDKLSDIDVNLILDSVLGRNGKSTTDGIDLIKFDVTPGTPEVRVPQDSTLTDVEIERISYEDQLEDLTTSIGLLLAGASHGLFITGRGGTGKSVTVKQALNNNGLQEGDGYVKLKTTATTVGIYQLLYKYRDSVLLFDDSDSIFTDQATRNIFKAATESGSEKRMLMWDKKSSDIVDSDIYDEDDPEFDSKYPNRYEFTGKIIFISNLEMDKVDPDGALRTRGNIFNISATNEEIYEKAAKIIMFIPLRVNYNLDKPKRLEILEAFAAKKRMVDTADLRTFERALNDSAAILLQGGDDSKWKTWIIRYC